MPNKLQVRRPWGTLHPQARAVALGQKVRFTFKKKGAKAVRVTKRVRAGMSRTAFTVRISRTKRLTPGTYRVTVRAKNAGGRGNRLRAMLTVTR